MLSLAVDTGTLSGSLAVLSAERLLGVVCTSTPETYSSRMFRQLEFLLGELQLDLARFDLYAVAAGPGSFTGLRVGLTAAKGWAEVYGRPIAAVSALAAIAANARAAAPLLVSLLDARRGQLFAGIYRRCEDGLTLEGEEQVLAPEDLPAWTAAQVSSAFRAGLAFVSPTPELIAPVLSASDFRSCPVEPVSPVLAPAVGLLGYAMARRGETTDSLGLDANYVRRSDAELAWKGR